MARFAPVCPVNIMHKLLDGRAAGTYHLPLAHDVLQYPKEYQHIFQEKIARGPHRTVILDNSVIELGSAVNKDVIAKAADIVDADVIVLPDVLRDYEATLAACDDAYHSWTNLLNDRDGIKRRSYMFVPQGSTLEEFVHCAERMADDYPDIGWWGIPRNFNIQGFGSRRTAVDICHMLNPFRKIHLLGFSDNILDDILSARDSRVAGIDSAVPLRAATLGLPMSLTLDKDLPPRMNWWEDPETVKTDASRACLNVVKMYDLLNGAA